MMLHRALGRRTSMELRNRLAGISLSGFLSLRHTQIVPRLRT